MKLAPSFPLSWIRVQRLNQQLSRSLAREKEDSRLFKNFVDSYFLELGKQDKSDALRNSAGVLTVRKNLARKAVEIYELLRQRSNAIDSYVDLATARTELAKIEADQGRLAEAIKILDVSVNQLNSLKTEFDDNPDFLYTFGKVLNTRGEYALDSLETDRAMKDFIECDQALEKFEKMSPDSLDVDSKKLLKKVKSIHWKLSNQSTADQ